MNSDQLDLIARAVARLPLQGQVIIATDYDPAGDKLAEAIRQAVESAARPDLHVIRHSPDQAGQDWNDVLRRSEAVQAQKAGGIGGGKGEALKIAVRGLQGPA